MSCLLKHLIRKIKIKVNEAHAFLDVLNSKHSALKFTMELAANNTLPFLGMNILKNGTKLETSVYKKPTNTGLLLHFHSHVDQRYKKGLLKTMLNRAYRLSSNWKHFINKCKALKLTFSNLFYPSQLIETTVNHFITNVATDNVQSDADRNNDTTPTVMFSIPFINQSAADSTRRQLQDLSLKIGVSFQPIFTSKKIGDIIKTREPKPKIINEQCVVYHFKCGLCEMHYVGFTNRHLFQRINEHTNSRSSIGKHMRLQHGVQ